MSQTTLLTTIQNALKPIQESSTSAAENDEQSNTDNVSSQNLFAGLTAQVPLDPTTDAFTQHFAADNKFLSTQTLQQVDQKEWQQNTESHDLFGNLSRSNIASTSSIEALKSNYNPKLIENISKTPHAHLQHSILDVVGTYQDLFYSRVQLDNHDSIRACLAMHCMNHIIRTRQRVLKNNERLAHSSEDSTDIERRDQGFTRPKVLILLPLRNSAVHWLEKLKENSLATTFEEEERFKNEYGLPEGSIDKLDGKEAHKKFPRDHILTFRGNIDDEFRLGLRVTRKSVKIYTEFYSSDIIIASPLGLRVTIEKAGNADFLSSIEVMIADQLDVMAMQNWDHVHFVFKHINQLPKSSHDCDISRLKPFYSDGRASNLRQTVLLSKYDLPEMRSIYNSSLVNVAGKTRTMNIYSGMIARVPKGIKQVFQKFVASEAEQEEDERFEYFKSQGFPAFLRQAPNPMSTVVFVPSYFDFVRLKAYFSTLSDITFGTISEYSPTSDVSRARTLFFKGEIQYLIVTERFHFFKRYKLRGAKSFFFYGPPDHSLYYPEIIQWPLDEDVSPGESKMDQRGQLFSYMMFCKYDFLRLERITGTVDARKMIQGGSQASKYSYT